MNASLSHIRNIDRGDNTYTQTLVCMSSHFPYRKSHVYTFDFYSSIGSKKKTNEKKAIINSKRPMRGTLASICINIYFGQ